MKLGAAGSKPSEAKIVWIGAIVFFTVILVFCLHRYYAFYADSDHGIFSQVFWNNSHGRFFQSSLSSTYSVSVTEDKDPPAVFYHRLAQHFTPILLLWAPLYRLFPSPVTLIVLKVALIALAGPVLYALSRQYLSPKLSGMMVVSFYVANTVIGPALGEFYDFSQIPLLVFGLLLALEKRWWWLFATLCLLTVMVREDAGLVVFGVGVYLIVSKRYPRIGLAVCAFSFLYMLLVTTVWMPLFTDEVSRRFMIEEFGRFTGDQQASTIDVIWAIARRPWLLVIELISPIDKTIRYLLGHWLPLAFIPAISPPAWIISGFPLLENLLRKEDGPLSLNIRYTTPIVPGLFYGAILWWSNHRERFKSIGLRRFWGGCMALSLLLTFTSNPHRAWSFLMPDSIQPWVYISLPQQWNHAAQVQSLLAQIPPDASVSASRYLVPHLPNRRAILRFPALKFEDDDRQVKTVEYVAVDLGRSLEYQVAFKTPREELKSFIPAIDRLIDKKRYGLIAAEGGAVVLQRGVESKGDSLASWQSFKQEVEARLVKQKD